MTWLTPALAGVVAAITIPALILLYFLKLRRRPVEISSTLLWKKAVQDLQANAPFQKLRRNILLLLQLLALIAMILALAQPQRDDLATVDDRHVILIDRSASMSAKDADGRTRLDRAKEDALALVDAMREGDFFSRNLADQRPQEAMVIAFDTTAEVLSTFTSDKARLRSAIRSIRPSHAPASLDAAMKLARAHAPVRRITDTFVDESGNTQSRQIESLRAGVGTIHILSDGRLADAQRVLAGVEDTLRYHPAGDPNEVNLAIATLRGERAYDDPDRLSIFIAVESNAPTARSIDIEMQIADAVRVYPLTIPARAPSDAPSADAPQRAGTPGQASTASTLIELTMPEGALVEFRLAGEAMRDDALEIDNRAWLVVPPARRTAVALVTAGNPFLSNWLATLGFDRFEVLAPDDAPDVLDEPFDVVILDRTNPFDDAQVPPGRYLMLGVLPPEGVASTGTAPNAQFLDWSREHPVTRDLTLEAVQIVDMPRLTIDADAGVRTLASTSAGPGILEWTAPELRAISVAFDPLSSTWPFDVSFPVFIAGAIADLSDDDEAGALAQLHPGQILDDRIPRTSSDVQIIAPDDRGAPTRAAQRLTPAPDGRIVFGPLDRVGVYKLRWKGPAGAGDVPDSDRVARYYACNLLDPLESDITPAPELAIASDVVSASARERRQVVRRYWPWLVLAALAILMLEWWVYNRKVHI